MPDVEDECKQKMTPFHMAARQWAEGGTPVFPCYPGTKVPIPKTGFKAASTDLAQIDAWWTQYPEANLAFSPEVAGWCVVDIDGSVGEDTWERLQEELGEAEPTYEVRTPRGGRHLYYEGSLPPSASTLGPKLDTRGRGSYVLLPPSVVEDVGVYTELENRAEAEVPAWIAPLLAAPKARARSSGVELDLPHSISRARSLLRSYVASGHVANEGEGGDNRTYAVAAEVMNLGLSPEAAFDVMQDWNDACSPPWEPDALALKITNAASYSQNEAGAWAVAPPRSTFGPVLDKLGIEWDRAEPPEPSADAPDADARKRFQSWSVEELLARPKPAWLIPDMLPERSLVDLFGPPDSYKTFLTLATLLPLSLDHDVIFVAGEGGSGLGERVNAWAIAHETPLSKLRLRVVEDMPLPVEAGDVEAFIRAMQGEGWSPAVVVIDTAARAMTGMDESSSLDMGRFVAAMDLIKRSLKCAVWIIHHTGKDASRGGRGSNALKGAVDVELEAEADTDAQVGAIHVRKMKDSKRRSAPFAFEGKDLAGSLVLWPLDGDEFKRRMNPEEDTLWTGSKVGGALTRLGAVDGEGVTSYVLAGELIGPGPSTEARQAQLDSVVRQLAKRAKGVLSAYANSDGKELKWWLPSGG